MLKNKLLRLSVGGILLSSVLTIPTSFMLIGCTNTTNDNNSSTTETITIGSKSDTNTQVDSNTTTSLYVDAWTNGGKTLSCQWYIATDTSTSEYTWEAIEGATILNYQIPKDVIKANAGKTIVYKVEIWIADNPEIKTEAQMFSVFVNKVADPVINFTTNLENSIDIVTKKNKDTKLTVDTSYNFTSTVIIYYKWYLSKNGGEYQLIQSDNPYGYNYYTILASDLSSITEDTTWSIYVEATPKWWEDSYEVYGSPTRSNICTINIKTGEIARTDVGNYGLTTVKHEQEKWIGDNSVSIGIQYTPNWTYIKEYVSTYLKNHSDDEGSTNTDAALAYSRMNDFNLYLQRATHLKDTTMAMFGTGWILDYSYPDANGDLINYYLATNIHVLDLSYQLQFSSSFFEEDSTQVSTTVTANIPINSKTVSSLNVYLSQPQYNTTSGDNNKTIPQSFSTTYWHTTPITINNFEDTIIPIGAYTNTGYVDYSSTFYNLSLTYSYYKNNSRINSGYYYPSSGNSGTNKVSKASNNSSDYAVIKIPETKTSFDDLGTDSNWTTVFQKMKTMFNINTNDISTTKRSSYIARLNSLYNLATSSSYSKTLADNLFMFADYKTGVNNKTLLSTAGFPGVSGSISFNSNSINYALTQTATSAEANSRTELSYTYRGQLGYSNYTWDNNILMENVNLKDGSSGSMTITQDYKIYGIYWGAISYYYGETYGVTTQLYSQNTDRNFVKIWLNYIETNDSSSKLYKTFKALTNKGYFN